MGILNLDRGRYGHDASLLTMPAEVRLQIYGILFPRPIYKAREIHQPVQPPSLADFGKPPAYGDHAPADEHHAAIVSACRQLCHETQLLYLENTIFHLVGIAADPVHFGEYTAHLPIAQKRAIRHIVLTARISHLRALNETWNSIPFGNENVFLETLTVVPRRPKTYGQGYAEVADLSQCHTLAYILTETLKGLSNVGTVTVRNEKCFNNVIWRLTYRSVVFRIFKWCGQLCDLRFKENEDEEWFSIRCATSRSRLDGLTVHKKKGEDEWNDVLQELNRLLEVGEDRDRVNQ
ncbi:hypothetical protein K461DRAFT_128874 [Myriangium duriaei CBS 260.36]|uniref:Uncharacterized protein n=1 Tax=Myriangium duriaei CBS 260.36 TaxID=1168546 RepID=A0A9P4MP66_9PEZI|nr:hypothetical protein K461DRAFT_128874 [Myriangium duriaei CBS 260.36]